MKESGISEIIGAFLLVALVMAGMAMIGVLLLSIPPPQSNPQVQFGVSCCQCEDNNYIILVYHLGGDEIKKSDIKLNITFEDKTYIENPPLFNYTDVMDSCSGVGSGEIINSNYLFKAGSYLKYASTYSSPPYILTIQNIHSNRILLNSSFSCNSC